MKLPVALIVSLLVTLALTGVLFPLFGVKAFGLFLFLPLGFLFRRSRREPAPPASPYDTAKPIEPK